MAKCLEKIEGRYNNGVLENIKEYFKEGNTDDNKKNLLEKINTIFKLIIETKPCTKQLIIDNYLNKWDKNQGVYNYVKESLNKTDSEAEAIVNKIIRGIEINFPQSNPPSIGGVLAAQGSGNQSSSSTNNNNGKCINCTEKLSDTVKGLTDQVTESARVLSRLDAYETKLKRALKVKIDELKLKWSKLTPEQKQQSVNEIQATQAKCEECQEACAEQMRVLQEQTEKLKDAMSKLGDRFESEDHVKDFVAEVTRGFADINKKTNMGRVVASAFGISNYKKSKMSRGSKKSKK